MNPVEQNILIVEDEQIIASTLAEKLEQVNLKVAIAENGQEGLDLALKSHPKLILLDIIMPKMSGIDMLKKLREDEWGKNAKVLVLTNQSNEDVISEAQKIGIDEYMIKAEHNLKEILEHIQKHLA